MAETTEPDPIEIGRLLFAKPSGFTWAAAKASDLPPMKAPEIAFAGRSNVGKSSLVNALTGRRTLARTSHTPGRTQQLNFFALGEALMLVDMPGYGYAAVGKEKIAAWTETVRDYLRGRANLQRVYLLIDSRHGFKAADEEIMDLLDKAATSYQVALTKTDQLRPAELATRLSATEAALARRPAAYPEVLATSSAKGTGVEAMRAAIARLLIEKGALVS